MCVLVLRSVLYLFVYLFPGILIFHGISFEKDGESFAAFCVGRVL